MNSPPRHVLSFAHKPPHSATRRGRVTKVDPTIWEVCVTDGEDASSEYYVSLSAADCSEHLSGVVRHGGSTAWIECESDDLRRCVALHLLVDAGAVDAALDAGDFPAEEHVVGLLRAVWREARVGAAEPAGGEGEVGKEADDTDGASSSTPLPTWSASYPLRPHQERTVTWMRGMEERFPVRLPYDGNVRVTDAWYVDTEAECFTTDPSPREARLSGGICADVVGSGKTASLLRLVAEDTAAARREEGSRMETDEEERGATNPATSSTASSPCYYASRATLVIVPLNLVSQWQTEAARFLSQEVRVRFLVGGREVRATTMATLCEEADLVITTFHFLRGCKAYSELVDEALAGRPRTRPVLSAWARQPGRCDPLLEAIEWRRVVVDELHDTLDAPRDLRALRLFRARATWGLTATPCLQTEQAQQLYFLLDREKAHHPNLLAAVVAGAVRRDGGGSSPEGGPTLSLNRVRVSAEERLLLPPPACALAEYVRRCTLPAAGEGGDGGDGGGGGGGGGGGEAAALLARREAAAARLTAHERAVRVMEEAGRQLETEMEEVSSACAQGDAVACKRAETLRRAADEAAHDLTLARTCAEAERGKVVRLEEAVRLARERAAVAERGGRRQTKMERVASLILSLAEPVVLFVQWKAMLRSARAFLAAAGVRVLSLDGNAAQRTAALSDFLTGGVLLLCLEDSFAGLHLPHVRHVVFAHAIVGDRPQVAALEQQAVGRVWREGQTGSVHVHSFVVTESEEERLWERTHD